MQTTDTDLLFQTDSEIADSARRQKKIKVTGSLGGPITLSSKILALNIGENEAWTAESGWQARCIDLNTGTTKRMFRGHTGPVTCVATCSIEGQSFLLTGSWDKTIRLWNTSTGQIRTTLLGHTDFIKSLTILPGHSLLSTSSDRTIRLWDLRPLASGQDPVCAQILRQHTRPVDCATWCPAAEGSAQVWTADSLGLIKQWHFDAAVSMRYVRDLVSHDTSVSQLRVCATGIWSASMDNSAVFHRFDGKPGLRITEANYIRAILSLDCIEGAQHLVVTGSDDENLRLWDIEDLDRGVPRLLSTVPGHAAQVSDLAIWQKKGAVEIVSASLDQTIRRWSLTDLLHPKQVEEAQPKETSGMTADEARELEDLLLESE